MKDLRYYLSLPWSIQRTELHDDGDYVTLRIGELPGFMIASANEQELNAIFWIELEAFLRTFLDSGEEPPVPDRVKLKEQLRRVPRVYADHASEIEGLRDVHSIEVGETVYLKKDQLQPA
jgi:hypothetical protein